MPAGQYNFTIEQNAKFSRVLTWHDSAGSLVSLTGYTAAMTLKNITDGEEIISLSTTADGSGNVMNPRWRSRNDLWLRCGHRGPASRTRAG